MRARLWLFVHRAALSIAAYSARKALGRPEAYRSDAVESWFH